MRKRVFRSLLLTISMALAASCVMLVDPEREGAGQPLGEFRKSVDFKAGGTVAVEHTLGDVTITGWDEDSVEVVATGRETEAGNRQRVHIYNAEDYEASIDVRQAGGALRIRTRSLGGPWDAGGLDYSIQVPSSINLNPVRLGKGDVSVSDIYGQMVVELTTGQLTVKNFSGPLKASIESGQADIELLDVRSEDTVDISIEKGDIILRLQPDASARVEAECHGGDITSDYDLGRKLPAKTLDGKLGKGEARIVLKALQGNIKILKTE